jgi:hypothetical protein
VAKQAKRLLEAGGLKRQPGDIAEVQLYTSGDVDAFKSILPKLLGEKGMVQPVTWMDDYHVVVTLQA